MEPRTPRYQWGELSPHLFDSATSALRPRRVHARKSGAQDDLSDRHLCCASCRAPVTEQDAAFSIDGAHRHTGTNPHGVTFEIGCFRVAPGCRQVGAETAEWSWFPGYRWQVVLCGGCGAHLGWCYRGVEPVFFGLILGQLCICGHDHA